MRWHAFPYHEGMETRLSEWRHRRNLTMAEAAYLIGLDRTWYGRLENGKGRPSGIMRRRIARATGLRAHEVVSPVRDESA